MNPAFLIREQSARLVQQCRQIDSPFESYAQRAEGIQRAFDHGHLTYAKAHQQLAALEADAVNLKATVERDSFLGYLKRIFTPKPRIAYYTVDGGVLCPHPGMTDDDLADYESCFGIPSSFPARS